MMIFYQFTQCNCTGNCISWMTFWLRREPKFRCAPPGWANCSYRTIPTTNALRWCYHSPHLRLQKPPQNHSVIRLLRWARLRVWAHFKLSTGIMWPVYIQLSAQDLLRFKRLRLISGFSTVELRDTFQTPSASPLGGVLHWNLSQTNTHTCTQDCHCHFPAKTDSSLCTSLPHCSPTGVCVCFTARKAEGERHSHWQAPMLPVGCWYRAICSLLCLSHFQFNGWQEIL